MPETVARLMTRVHMRRETEARVVRLLSGLMRGKEPGREGGWRVRGGEVGREWGGEWLGREVEELEWEGRW